MAEKSRFVDRVFKQQGCRTGTLRTRLIRRAGRIVKKIILPSHGLCVACHDVGQGADRVGLGRRREVQPHYDVLIVVAKTFTKNVNATGVGGGFLNADFESD